MASQYSPELYQYIGRIALDAFQQPNSYAHYTVFRDALKSLDGENLSGEDLRLARRFLEKRTRETCPHNIGCASGEAGEAD